MRRSTVLKVTRARMITIFCFIRCILLIGKSICAFNRDSTKIFVVSSEGTFTSCSFLEGGECTRLTSTKIYGTSREMDDDIAGQSSAANYSPDMTGYSPAPSSNPGEVPVGGHSTDM
jgi:hypothetical protein